MFSISNYGNGSGGVLSVPADVCADQMSCSTHLLGKTRFISLHESSHSITEVWAQLLWHKGLRCHNIGFKTEELSLVPSRKGTYLPILMEIEHPNVLFLLDMRSVDLERKKMSQLPCAFFTFKAAKLLCCTSHPLPQGKRK